MRVGKMLVLCVTSKSKDYVIIWIMSSRISSYPAVKLYAFASNLHLLKIANLMDFGNILNVLLCFAFTYEKLLTHSKYAFIKGIPFSFSEGKKRSKSISANTPLLLSKRNCNQIIIQKSTNT